MIPYNLTITLYPHGDLDGETSIISNDTTIFAELLSLSVGSFQFIATVEGFNPAISPIVNIASNDIYKIIIYSSDSEYANYLINIRAAFFDENDLYSLQNSMVYLEGNFEIVGNLTTMSQDGSAYFEFYTPHIGILILTVSVNGISKSIFINILPDYLVMNSVIPQVVFT